MRYTFVFILVAFSLNAAAQVPRDIRQGNSDYPVPVPIALLAVSNGSPQFLEPSTVRTLGIATQGIWQTSATPHFSGGFEFAPVMLGANLDQSDYLSGRIDRVGYRVRLSFAAEASEWSGLNTAVGLRLMLHDDADPRADSSWLRTLITWTTRIPVLFAQCNGDSITESGRRCLSEAIAHQTSEQTRIDSFRHAFMESHWNKSVFELAFAAVYHSDAARNLLTVQRYAGFFSAGYQFQAGLSGWIGHDERFPYYQRRGAITFRWQLGDAGHRAFAGVAMSSRSDAAPDHRAEFGILTNLANGFWLRGVIGASLHQHPTQGPEAGLTFAFGTPELQ